MTVAWELPIPTGQKMVLLSLCDNANDQGECYPSVPTIARKCSMSERSIFSHIDWLEKNKILYRENRKGRSSIYHIHPCKYCTPANSAPTPANIAPQPLQILHPTPANIAPITINEPSKESSKESSIAKKQKSNLLDGIDLQIASDFLAIRKAKNLPLTKTALNAIEREAGKMGYTLEQALTICCERGWGSFKAEWVLRESTKGTVINKQEALEQSNRSATAGWIPPELRELKHAN
jgi:hypothetical protein